ncbi:MAG TPA: SEC-C metal-binding domain-containing protein, partial [Polyangiaceae bacterium]|nr:SEC-C metal-binding domain-containing protein [Polyangiaceae bacterium]
IFAGDRVKSLMERMGMPDNEPIVHPWVTGSIQDAQRKVEERNFDMRKHLLEYDDVMNEQRKTVYKLRQQLLLGIYKPEKMDEDGKLLGEPRDIVVDEKIAEDVKKAVTDIVIHHGTAIGTPTSAAAPPKTVEEVEEIYSMASLQQDIYQFWGYRFDYREGDGKKPLTVYNRLLEEIPQSLTEQHEQLLDLLDNIVGAVVEECCPSNKPPEDWDWKGIKVGYIEHFGGKSPEVEHLHAAEQIAKVLFEAAEATVREKQKEMGTELLLRVFRHFYLEEIDRQWVEHLTNMEHLRDGIGLRGYGQRDPKQEYKKEGYDIFMTMMAATSSNVCSKLFKVQVRRENEIERIEREDAEKHAQQQRAMQTFHGGENAQGEDEGPPRPAARAAQPRVVQPPVRREGPKVGRNDPCPCGSGQKFKKCHGAALEEDSDASEDASV